MCKQKEDETMKKTELAIPVSQAFERRLAELVWENCPELARQTAAGRMALAIDVSNPATIDRAKQEAMAIAVNETVGPLVESVRARLEQSDCVEQVVADASQVLEKKLATIRDQIETRVESMIDKSISHSLSNVVLPEVRDVAECHFRERPLARLVREKLELVIAEYLAEKLEIEKNEGRTLIAAEAEMAMRVRGT